jgi:hypothetical protein
VTSRLVVTRQLNLVSSTADRELDLVREQVAAFDTVDDLEGLCATLRHYVLLRAHVEVLDLIGHSRSPGFVVIGSWVIDDSPQTAASFDLLLNPLLRPLGVRTIRLLGCSTAATQQSRRAIRRVAQATGCNVFGTRRYLSRNDYGATGFISTSTLVDGDGHRHSAAQRNPSS